MARTPWTCTRALAASRACPRSRASSCPGRKAMHGAWPGTPPCVLCQGFAAQLLGKGPLHDVRARALGVAWGWGGP